MGMCPWAYPVGDSDSGTEEAETMKHTARTALWVGICVALIGICVVLLAGKDDIRKFRRMHSM
jgi:Na+-driven multidrug efflux pump